LTALADVDVAVLAGALANYALGLSIERRGARG
jgi:hypothetical protein